MKVSKGAKIRNRYNKVPQGPDSLYTDLTSINPQSAYHKKLDVFVV